MCSADQILEFFCLSSLTRLIKSAISRYSLFSGSLFESFLFSSAFSWSFYLVEDSSSRILFSMKIRVAPRVIDLSLLIWLMSVEEHFDVSKGERSHSLKTLISRASRVLRSSTSWDSRFSSFLISAFRSSKISRAKFLGGIGYIVFKFVQRVVRWV